jgi:hypothetical protein
MKQINRQIEKLKQRIKGRAILMKASVATGMTVLSFYCTKAYVLAAEEIPTDLPTGSWLKDWVLKIAQNAFIVLLAYGAVKAFGKKAWVSFITLVAAGAIAAYFIYFPDDAVSLLKKFGGKLGD